MAYFIDLNSEYSGANSPEGPSPWVRLLFSEVDSDTVRLTITNNGLIEQEFLTTLAFNYDPTLPDPTFTYVSGDKASKTKFDKNNVNADGAHGFDIEFTYPKSGIRANLSHN